MNQIIGMSYFPVIQEVNAGTPGTVLLGELRIH